MTKKKKLLLVSNAYTQTNTILNNPVLWYIYGLLKNRYDVSISGESLIVSDKTIKYSTHSRLYSIAVKLKLFFVIRTVCFLFCPFNKAKREAITKMNIQKFRLFLQETEFNFKTSPADFIINIDTEAAFLSRIFSKKYGTPLAYFIYEFYVGQSIDEKNDLFYDYRKKLEQEVVRNTTIILSSCNELSGDFN